MQVIWSTEATNSFYNNRNYLLQNWNHQIAQHFTEKALHTINLLTKNPYLGKYKIDLKCNVILISKQISLHYEIDNSCIILLFFWDNRKNLKKSNSY
jgi:plasmid stabilization system protein ParE